jgi:hypothetical protein
LNWIGLDIGFEWACKTTYLLHNIICSHNFLPCSLSLNLFPIYINIYRFEQNGRFAAFGAVCTQQPEEAAPCQKSIDGQHCTTIDQQYEELGVYGPGEHWIERKHSSNNPKHDAAGKPLFV